MKRFYVPLLALALVGCGDEGPEIPVFDGRWTGVFEGAQVTVIANENERDLSGTGTFTSATGAAAFTFEGVHTFPDVSFTARASGFEDWNFTGQFEENDSDAVSGTLNGSGFLNNPLTLRRE